ncbi:phosphoenolpyruvate--protein phosphotransferase [Coraliomargarita akajimensis]|uniref:Phosphoenolpyruvate-protein phosphotransferase n=1 Tax=Coraliomargarita akajimensis (strain DSM 45221 / IAM 15411 / JCM 23193 / KCTC 12865 / 04OKA010-24) TaxID=583355 RepID=D5EN28_CORAD|nr:phosphoenolpyruvate--protein phosphotransferase [Coraliomargarita akajimensis]ADE53463.1 phosphoenolpyruvate-protein phosphotransferase [Coraliomargarita akajimensis DSM 45221]
MSETTNNQEIILEGIAASPGVAHGKVFVYLQRQLDVPCYDIQGHVDAETARFDQALLETRAQITQVRDKIAASLGEGEARIFDAHLLVLEDNALIEEVIAEVKSSNKNIEFCFNKVAERYIQFFNSMEDDYLKERVADIQDVSRRVMHNLTGMHKVGLGDLAENCIIISEDISPSEAADLDRDKLLGFATDAGGKTSHSVIMARSLRIPAVVGLHDATQQLKSGDEIIIDGHAGLLIINPSEERLYTYGQLDRKRRARDEIYESSINEPCVTADGREIALMANIEGAQDLAQVDRVKAHGVGLFRTEGIFLRHHGYPPEAIQYDEYMAVAKASDNPVIIRTLDIGGDKTLGTDSDKEDNSFMGFRAIRFCLENVEIFKTQLRAILRASAHGNVKLMYPMISGLSELRRANEILEEVKTELRDVGEAFDEGIEVGAMVEVPSAAAIIDLLAKEADFLSIGTNDLIQYLIAVDRLNDRVAHLYEPTHPAVLRTLKLIIDGARENGTHVSVCGEIAGDPIYASLLLGMGAHSLSLTPAMLPEVKYFLRKMKAVDAERLVAEVLKMEDAIAIHEHLCNFHSATIGELLEAGA